VVVHAGLGAETTGNVNDIWSHKWVLPGGEFNADSSKIYAYLTVPENAKIGVCCHELGHLLFGFPDLYDTDYSSEGVGNWCLMGGGSWLGGGDKPGHPSAWCKLQQGWAGVVEPSNGNLAIEDVKTSHTVYRLWKNNGSGDEYFLVENRQKILYDEKLPGAGLLIWHIDDSISGNSNEIHPRVALVQADGHKDLENGSNRGDAGDPYPGASDNRSFTLDTTPSSRSYAGVDTCVKLTIHGENGPLIQAEIETICEVPGGGEPEKEKKGCLAGLMGAALGVLGIG
jgi:immune inhibitor A